MFPPLATVSYAAVNIRVRCFNNSAVAQNGDCRFVEKFYVFHSTEGRGGR